MKAETVKLYSGKHQPEGQKYKSGSELFDKLLMTEFGEFCLNSFMKGCVRNSSDLEGFKAKYQEQSETIVQIFNYLLENDIITVNDNGYFNINNYFIDLTLNENLSKAESNQIKFLYSEKVKKMSLSALDSVVSDPARKPYIGNMVFALSDHPDVEVKKSMIASEILRLLKELTEFDAKIIREGYKSKKVTNFAFIGAISSPEYGNSEDSL